MSVGVKKRDVSDGECRKSENFLSLQFILRAKFGPAFTKYELKALAISLGLVIFWLFSEIELTWDFFSFRSIR